MRKHVGAVVVALAAVLAAAFITGGGPEAALIRKAVDFGPPFVESGTTCMVRVDDLPVFALPGMPLLPVFTLKVVLPHGEAVVSVSGTQGHVEAWDLPAPLEWEQPQTPMSWEGPFERVPAHAAVFGSDAEHPAARAVHVTTQTFRGYNVAIIRVYPVTYLGARNSLHWTSSIEVEIVTAPDERLLRRSLGTLRGDRRADESRLARVAEDVTCVSSYSSADVLTLGSSMVDPSLTYPYVIITNSALEPVFEDLKSLKDSQGLTTRIVHVSDIASTYSGIDLQDKIREFIRDAYLNWGTEYVLLGGDDSIIPHRGLYAEILPYVTDDDVAADIYYGGLDGDWNDDGDGLWGEPGEADLMPEVSIGRAPVETTAEAANFVGKVIRYQTSPVVGQIKNAQMTAELLYDEPTWGSYNKEEIVSGSSAHGFTTAGIPPSWTVTELYDRDLYPAEWDKWDVINNLNSGIHIQNHCGHSINNHTMKMYDTDILAHFTNDGITNTYFIAFVQGCFSAAFDNRWYDGSYGNDAVGEVFTYIEGGAVGYMGTTRYGASAHESTRGAGQYYDRQFFDAVFGEGITAIGDAHDDCKVDNIPYIDFRALRWEYYARVLLGEPSMDIWTDAPGELTVTLPGAIHTSANEVEISVTDGSTPVEGARVSIVGDSTHYCHGFTDAGGAVYLNPSVAQPGSVYVAVIAHNFHASLDTLAVAGAAHALLMLDSISVDDDGTGESDGDGDGEVEAGETVESRVTVENIGADTAAAVTGTLRVQDAYVTVIDSLASYGDIDPGGTGGPDAEFVYGIDPHAPDGHSAEFEVHLSYSDTALVRHYTVDILAPRVETGGLAIDDASYGDGNGCVGPGETVELDITLENEGSGDGAGITLTLSESDPYVDIIVDEAYIAVLPPGGQATATPSLVMSIAPDCPGAHRVDLSIDIDFASGRTAASSAAVFVGGTLSDDLESGQGAWYHEDIVAGFIDQWHLDDYRNHTPGGSWCWKFGGSGADKYAHYSHGALVTPELCLGPNATLTFWHYIRAELETGDYASDGGIVELSTDGGETWNQIAPQGGYPHRIYPGTSTPIPPETPCFAWTSGWTQVQFDLSSYEGPARIRFNFGSGEHFGTEEGWYVDDVVVTDDVAAVKIDDDDLREVPAVFALGRISPNPVRRRAEIVFEAPTLTRARIEVYDVGGKLLSVIADSVFSPGRHSVALSGAHVPGPGVYFIRMRAGGFEATRKAVILR